MSAQVAHIHFELGRKVLLNQAGGGNPIAPFVFNRPLEEKPSTPVLSEEKLDEWLKQPYLLVKQVPNLEALRYFQAEATKKDIVVSEWFDTVYVRLSKTKQQAFPNVLVGISLGPDDADVIRTVVGDLPLL